MTRMVIVIQISSDPSLFDPHFAAVAAAQKPPSSSSMLMGRQIFPMGPGPALDVLPPGTSGSVTTPSNFNPSHSSTSTSYFQPLPKDHEIVIPPNFSPALADVIPPPHKSGNQPNPSFSTLGDTTSKPVGALPAIARRRLRPTWGSEGSPDIFDRDDSPTRRSNPITVSDIFARYLRRTLAEQKRAAKPRTSRDFN